tara:strand:+ start:112 stop:492 length:381 start_codon:yes stop_codon:yes gene_type:complete
MEQMPCRQPKDTVAQRFIPWIILKDVERMAPANPPNHQVFLHQKALAMPQKPVLAFDLGEAIDAIFLNSFFDESNEKFFLYEPLPNDLISMELANVHRTEHSKVQGHKEHNYLELDQASKASANQI